MQAFSIDYTNFDQEWKYVCNTCLLKFVIWNSVRIKIFLLLIPVFVHVCTQPLLSLHWCVTMLENINNFLLINSNRKGVAWMRTHRPAIGIFLFEFQMVWWSDTVPWILKLNSKNSVIGAHIARQNLQLLFRQHKLELLLG